MLKVSPTHLYLDLLKQVWHSFDPRLIHFLFSSPLPLSSSIFIPSHFYPILFLCPLFLLFFSCLLLPLPPLPHLFPPQVRKDFLALLRETSEIDRHSRYSEIKKKIDSDPRYKAVESSSLREDLFRDYIHELKEERRRQKDKEKETKRGDKERKKEEKEKDGDKEKEEEGAARSGDEVSWLK